MNLTTSTTARSAAATAAVIAILTAAGCQSPAEADFDFHCPEGLKPSVVILDDVTGSGRDDAILGARLGVIRERADYVADCGGQLTVVAYGRSDAAHAVVFPTGALPTPGHTEAARDRNIPSVVDTAMKQIDGSLRTAFGQIDSQGSDPTVPFRLLADTMATTRDDTHVVEAVVLSDMIGNTDPIQIDRPDVTVDQATQLANSVKLPDLGGVAVFVRGVGRVAGNAQPPSEYVQVVRTVASILCERSGGTCVVTSTES